MKVQNYVVGFCFNEAMDKVVLIRKQKPEWQKGNLNGVGGKVEPNETAGQAMIREFKEETSVFTETWKHYAKLEGEGWSVFCYYLRSDYCFEVSQTAEIEEIEKVNVDSIPFQKRIYNLTWLIPLAIQSEISWIENIIIARYKEETANNI